MTDAYLSNMLAYNTSTGGLDDEANRVLRHCEALLFGFDLWVYLKTDVSGERTSALEQELRAMPEVLSLTYIGKDEALARVKEAFKDQPEILENLGGNPFPASFEIRLKQLDQIDAVLTGLRSRPEVDQATRSIDPSTLLALFHAPGAESSSTSIGASTSTTVGPTTTTASEGPTR